MHRIPLEVTTKRPGLGRDEMGEMKLKSKACLRVFFGVGRNSFQSGFQQSVTPRV